MRGGLPASQMSPEKSGKLIWKEIQTCFQNMYVSRSAGVDAAKLALAIWLK
jgi:hypothetical protein